MTWQEVDAHAEELVRVQLKDGRVLTGIGFPMIDVPDYGIYVETETAVHGWSFKYIESIEYLGFPDGDRAQAGSDGR